ncbi:MAG: hypothetical protein DLM53_00260 [Candidatus Eremiobacter antarcticus]|nr:MAG: hypothetical protein DLM53_00260 [Candidatus Eremiobacter sp. RRmetagenome_bin22]
MGVSGAQPLSIEAKSKREKAKPPSCFGCGVDQSLAIVYTPAYLVPYVVLSYCRLLYVAQQ